MKYRKITAMLLGMTLAVSACSTVLAAETELSSAESSTVSETESSSAESSTVSEAESSSAESSTAAETELSSAESSTASEAESSSAETGNAEETENTENTEPGAAERSASDNTPATIAAIDSLALTDMFSNKDLDDSVDKDAVQITLKDTSAESDSSSVQIDGTAVTITEAGTYVLSGSLTNGQVVVDVPDTEKVKLVLDGVGITNDDSACIFVKSADKVIMTLAEGSDNTLADTGAAYVQPDEGSTVDGVIFSREDLSVNGKGSLTVTAEYKHGIVCKDDLILADGVITVDAAAKGIVGEDSVRVKSGTVIVTSGDDAIHSDTNDKTGKGFVYVEGGSLKLETGDDGIHAATSLIIVGGEIDVTGSYEGLEGATIDILDGDIRVSALDDGLNAAYSVSVPDDYVPDDSDWLEYMEDYNAMEKEWLQQMEDHNSAERDWLEYMGEYDPDDDDWSEYMDGYDFGYENRPEYRDDYGFDDEYWPEYMDGYDFDDEDWGYQNEYAFDDIDQDEYRGGLNDRDMRGGRRWKEPGREYGGSGMTPGGFGGDPGTMREGTGDIYGGAGGMRGGFGMMDVQEDSYLRISGGTVCVNAGGDGLDSNGYLYLEGGTVIVEGPADKGNGALDYGIDAVVTDGTLLAVGSAGMAQGFGNGSTQNSLYYTFDTGISAGTELTIADEDGNEIFSCIPEKNWQNIVFTSPDLEEGTVYTITAGKNSGSAEAGTGQGGAGFGTGGGLAGAGSGPEGGMTGDRRF